MNFTPEFELALACCRWPPGPDRDRAVRRAASRLDWDSFLAVVSRHRVDGLVHAALTAAEIKPAQEAARTMAATALDIARRSLAQAAEAGRLGRRLYEADIHHLFLKGATVAILAYRSLALKRAWDIDILVDPERYDDACTLLEEAGYDCIAPRRGASRAEIHRYAEAEKETVWIGTGGMHVELHKRLLPNPRLLPALSVESLRQHVEIAPGLVLPTFAPAELFAYLCAHGAVSGWSRLKWAADLNALLSREGPEAIERLYRCARELGAGRGAAQGLLLCNRLFGLALGEALEDELRSSRMNLYLLGVALGALGGGRPAAELRSRKFGTARVNLSTFFLAPGLRYKASSVAQLLRRRALRPRAPRPGQRPAAASASER